MIRAAVEAHARCDALDMSWVRFWGLWRAASRIERMKEGKPLTHAMLKAMREEDGWEV